MTLVAIRILLITDDLNFAVRMKQALEKMGGFVVSPFTGADTAFDHLVDRPHDVVLVDFNLPGMPTMDIVLRLRSIQPDIAIVLSPNLPEVVAIVRDMQLNGIVNMPCTMRELIPVIEKSLRQTQDALPDTAEAPALGNDSETVVMAQAEKGLTVPEFSSLGDVLVHTGGLDSEVGAETLDVDMSNAAYAEGKDGAKTIEFVLTGDLSALRYVPAPAVDEDSAQLHRQLAEDEPPMPTLEENGSVADLRAEIGDADLHEVAEAIKQDQTIPPDGDDDDDSGEDSPAKIILETTAEEIAEPSEISLEELLNSLIRRFPEGEDIEPLPSWVQDIEQYVREPDFLDMPLDEMEMTDHSSFQTTRMSRPEEIVPEPGDMMTDRFPGDFVAAVEASPEDDEPPVITESEEESPVEVVAVVDDYTESEEVVEAPKAVLEDMPEEDELAMVPEQVTGTPVEMDEVVVEAVADFNAEEEAEQVQAFVPVEPEAPPIDVPQPSVPIELEEEALVAAVPEQSIEPVEPITPTAQLALSFTQASLELTADAVLLARDSEIMAYAGNMPLEDIKKLREGIQDDWEARPGESRIRFVTLPSSGQDFMLYSRLTEDGYTLSMIFTGNTPLRIIRRQSDRLVDALRAVPEMDWNAQQSLLEDLEAQEAIQELEAQVVAQEEAALEASTQLRIDQMAIAGVVDEVESTDADAEETSVEDESEELDVVPVYAGPLEAHTYLWLVRDADIPLGERIAESIQTELNQQLTTMGWGIGDLRVAEDYVYLVADIPAEQAAQEIVTDLKQRAAAIAQDADDALDPDSLWAESYAVLTPGREMDTEEIQRFIHFGRTV
jgi:DNA-binding response OmpR family regulator